MTSQPFGHEALTDFLKSFTQLSEAAFGN